MTSEEKHLKLVDGLAKRLRATPTVFNLTTKRVVVAGDPDAPTGLPRVVVEAGKLFPAQASDEAVLRQANVEMTIEAAATPGESPEAGVLKLAGYVRKAIQSAGFLVEGQRFVCLDTGAPAEVEGGQSWTIRDRWASHIKHTPTDE